MPNQYQFAFLASLFLTFTALLLTSRFINSKLLAAGYDISELILIGLPKNSSLVTNTTWTAMGEATIPLLGNLEEIKAHMQSLQEKMAPYVARLVEIAGPYLQKIEWKEVVGSPAFGLTFAILVATFIYTKFVHTGRSKSLDPSVWQEFPLSKKIIVSPNTAVYRFALPHPQDVLGLPIGQHVSVAAQINGKEVVRSYTPTSSDDDLGHFDLLIKTYEKGNISKYFSLLKIGDKVRFKGPKGQFHYSPSLTREIGMIAGGTGITPMIQIIRAALKNPFDRTVIRLIYANVNEEDILLRDELETLIDVHGETRFKIYYVLNNPPAGWKGGVGFVSKEQIKEHMPPTDSNIKILMCGPPPMMTAMKKHLIDLNYPAPRTVSKLADQVFLF